MTVAPFASAGSLDACAQRVIRDWYSGGRVDSVYPLACYRAAIRALPNDVLEYSDADTDIARALAFARRGRTDLAARRPSADPEPETPAEAKTSPSPATITPSAAAPQATARATPRLTRPVGGPTHVAGGPEPTEVSAAVPYPVLILGALAGTLLATGAVGWLAARRR